MAGGGGGGAEGDGQGAAGGGGGRGEGGIGRPRVGDGDNEVEATGEEGGGARVQRAEARARDCRGWGGTKEGDPVRVDGGNSLVVVVRMCVVALLWWSW